MNKELRVTQRRFWMVSVFGILAVVALIWVTLQAFNLTNLGAESSSEELHSIVKESPAVVDYITSQEKANEPHFIEIASLVKADQQSQLTTTLAVVSIGSVVVAIGAGWLISRRLMQPVREAYASQERFLQDAAHELRNPLAAMSLSLQEAERRNQNSKLLDTFKRQTSRLVRINEDLLYLERAPRDTIDLVNISDLLLDVIEDLRPAIAGKKLKTKLKIEKNVEKRMSEDDFVRFSKNIIENAIKYSNSGKSIQITLYKKDKIYLIVEDKGIGIPPEDIDKIGERFFRAANTGKHPGTGLGLAIVNKIANLYGGNTQIESVEGKGTTVKVTL